MNQDVISQQMELLETYRSNIKENSNKSVFNHLFKYLIESEEGVKCFKFIKNIKIPYKTLWFMQFRREFCLQRLSYHCPIY